MTQSISSFGGAARAKALSASVRSSIAKRAVKKATKVTRAKILEALHKESEKNEREQILARLSLPPNKRTHFLRKRFSWGGSAL
jgi:hypothetical protein